MVAATSKFIKGKNIFVWVDVNTIYQAKISLDHLILASLHNLWASSFIWNARDGADSQVLGVTLGVKLIFVFSVTFGTKGLWG